MRTLSPLLLATTMFTFGLVGTCRSQDPDKKMSEAAFSLGDVKYYHRFTQDDLHEYTPAGQEDLEKWTEMVTIHYFRNVTDGEGLAARANVVLANYQAAQGVVVRTDSVPRTKDKEAEHLIVVAFGRSEFYEAAFARLRMHDGVGTAVICSHRIYGKDDVAKEMTAWLKKNGPDTEKTLMEWDAMPKPSAVK